MRKAWTECRSQIGNKVQEEELGEAKRETTGAWSEREEVIGESYQRLLKGKAFHPTMEGDKRTWGLMQRETVAPRLQLHRI